DNLAAALSSQQQQAQDGARSGREHAALLGTGHVLAGHSFHGGKGTPEFRHVGLAQDTLAGALDAHLAEPGCRIDLNDSFIDRPVEDAVDQIDHAVGGEGRGLPCHLVSEASDLDAPEIDNAPFGEPALDVAAIDDPVGFSASEHGLRMACEPVLEQVAEGCALLVSGDALGLRVALLAVDFADDLLGATRGDGKADLLERTNLVVAKASRHAAAGLVADVPDAAAARSNVEPQAIDVLDAVAGALAADGACSSDDAMIGLERRHGDAEKEGQGYVREHRGISECGHTPSHTKHVRGARRNYGKR